MEIDTDVHLPDITDRPSIPHPIEEDVIPDDSLHSVSDEVDDLRVTYELIDGATRGRNTLLVDSLGFTYTKKALGKKMIRSGKCIWRCSVRSKALTCPATVIQGPDS